MVRYLPTLWLLFRCYSGSRRKDLTAPGFRGVLRIAQDGVVA